MDPGLKAIIESIIENPWAFDPIVIRYWVQRLLAAYEALEESL
jgi:hypothetical protein